MNTDFIVSFTDLFKTDGEYYSQFEPKKLVEVNLQNGETLNVESTAEEILSMLWNFVPIDFGIKYDYS